MKKIIIFIGILLLIGVFFFGNNYYSNLMASLTYREKIEEISDGGFGNSIALKQNGDPVISYITKENKLIFKEIINNNWQEEIISDDVLAGNKTKIAIDNNENIYVLYITKENYLNLAKRNLNYWETERVFENAALDCNLFIDKNNVIYISFWSPKEGLAYGKKQNNNWDINIIDYGKVGWWNSLFIDSNSNPHISYFDFENKDLLYLFFDGNSWKKETVDYVGEVGLWNSIVVDKDNNPYIGYFNQTDGNLKFAQKIKGGWLIETIDKDGVMGERTNIVLDENREPVIAYSGLSDNSFKVAKKYKNNWKIIVISVNNQATDLKIKGEGSLDNSIIINSDGIFSLLWQDLFKDKLYYLQENF